MRTFGMAALVVVALSLTGCTAGEQHAPVPGATVDGADAMRAGNRAAHTATSLADGRILVAGGCVVDGCGTASADAMIIGADGRTVVPVAPLSLPRTNHTANLVPDGRVVVVGGFLGEGEGVTGSIDVLDPVGATTAPAETVVPRGGHAAAVLPDGRVLVVGGDAEPGGFTASAEVFDPETGAVAAARPLPWAADALEATSLADGRVLVTGGRVDRGTGTDAAAVYEPDRDEWVAVGSLAVPRFKHFQVTLSDGRVLVGGGTADDRGLHASTEVFDPAAGGFSSGPDLTQPRYKLSGGALALADGRVVVGAGGDTVELIDVAAGTSRVVAELDTTASFATVSLLEDQSVLLLGGYDDRIALTGLMREVAIPDRR
ncbi:Kelch repeat-containing protein [Agromyces neolithicus]|uniref:Galactose oxidase n=1 Tax=Agromyces neolithicus TaxID=269420 RepID=A0ABN2LWR4_9MICO